MMMGFPSHQISNMAKLNVENRYHLLHPPVMWHISTSMHQMNHTRSTRQRRAKWCYQQPLIADKKPNANFRNLEQRWCVLFVVQLKRLEVFGNASAGTCSYFVAATKHVSASWPVAIMNVSWFVLIDILDQTHQAQEHSRKMREVEEIDRVKSWFLCRSRTAELSYDILSQCKRRATLSCTYIYYCSWRVQTCSQGRQLWLQQHGRRADPWKITTRLPKRNFNQHHLSLPGLSIGQDGCNVAK